MTPFEPAAVAYKGCAISVHDGIMGGQSGRNNTRAKNISTIPVSRFMSNWRESRYVVGAPGQGHKRETI